jgi:hypothetical protein
MSTAMSTTSCSLQMLPLIITRSRTWSARSMLLLVDAIPSLSSLLPAGRPALLLPPPPPLAIASCFRVSRYTCRCNELQQQQHLPDAP